MKKILVFLISILFIPSVHALTVEQVPINDFVNDYADVLSRDVEMFIKESSLLLDEADGTQIVVVTVKSLEGENLEEFTKRLGNHYKVGRDSKGVIIFIAVQERLARVEIGDNLVNILSNEKVGHIMDTYMIPYLKNDNYDAGIKNSYIALRNEIIDKNNIVINKTPTEAEERKKFLEGIKSIPISLITSFLLLIIASFFGMVLVKTPLNIYDLGIAIFATIPLGISFLFEKNQLGGVKYMVPATIVFYILLRLGLIPSHHRRDDDWLRTGNDKSSSSGGFRSSGESSHSSIGSSSSSSYTSGGGHFSGNGASRKF